MVAMLRAVGIRAALKTPEWPTLWTDVQKGRVPFYYMGRGLMISGGPAISQYFETDESPRIGYRTLRSMTCSVGRARRLTRRTTSRRSIGR